MSDNKKEHPLILVCYIDNKGFQDVEQMSQIVDNVNEMIAQKEANIITFFIPTDSEQRIECINPVLSTDEQKNKIDFLINEISNSFGVDDYEGSAVKPFKSDES